MQRGCAVCFLFGPFRSVPFRSTAADNKARIRVNMVNGVAALINTSKQKINVEIYCVCLPFYRVALSEAYSDLGWSDEYQMVSQGSGLTTQKL